MSAHVYFIPKDVKAGDTVEYLGAYDPTAPTVADLADAIDITCAITDIGFTTPNTKEHTMALPTTNFAANLSLQSAISILANYTVLPEAQIGFEHYTGQDTSTDPWKARVGSLHISHKSSADRHIELALEHLVAAQTFPVLVKAWEAEQTRLAELAEAETRKAQEVLWSTPEALAAFDLYIDTYNCAYMRYKTWADVNNGRGPLEGDVEKFIQMRLDGSESAAEKEERYCEKRREELARQFTPFAKLEFRDLSSSTQNAIEFIVHKEINDGATR